MGGAGAGGGGGGGGGGQQVSVGSMHRLPTTTSTVSKAALLTLVIIIIVDRPSSSPSSSLTSISSSRSLFQSRWKRKATIGIVVSSSPTAPLRGDDGGGGGSGVANTYKSPRIPTIPPLPPAFNFKLGGTSSASTVGTMFHSNPWFLRKEVGNDNRVSTGCKTGRGAGRISVSARCGNKNWCCGGVTASAAAAASTLSSSPTNTTCAIPIFQKSNDGDSIGGWFNAVNFDCRIMIQNLRFETEVRLSQVLRTVFAYLPLLSFGIAIWAALLTLKAISHTIIMDTLKSGNGPHYFSPICSIITYYSLVTVATLSLFIPSLKLLSQLAMPIAASSSVFSPRILQISRTKAACSWKARLEGRRTLEILPVHRALGLMFLVIMLEHRCASRHLAGMVLKHELLVEFLGYITARSSKLSDWWHIRSEKSLYLLSQHIVTPLSTAVVASNGGRRRSTWWRWKRKRIMCFWTSDKYQQTETVAVIELIIDRAHMMVFGALSLSSAL